MDLAVVFGVKKKPFLAVSFHRVRLMKILVLCFLVGLVYGVLVFCFNFKEVGAECNFIVKRFLSGRFSQSFFMTCFCSFFSYFVPVFFIFILGFVPVLQFVFFVVPMFYGFGFGFFVSYLLLFRGLEGLLIVLMEVLPCALISVLVLVLCCKEGFRFANRTFKKLFLRASDFVYKHEVKVYFIKFLTLFGFQLVASVLDGFFNFVFFKFSGL